MVFHIRFVFHAVGEYLHDQFHKTRFSFVVMVCRREFGSDFLVQTAEWNCDVSGVVPVFCDMPGIGTEKLEENIEQPRHLHCRLRNLLPVFSGYP